jgi:hypothetical protein
MIESSVPNNNNLKGKYQEKKKRHDIQPNRRSEAHVEPKSSVHSSHTSVFQWNHPNESPWQRQTSRIVKYTAHSAPQMVITDTCSIARKCLSDNIALRKDTCVQYVELIQHISYSLQILYTYKV